MDVDLAKKQLTMMQELHNIDDAYVFYYDETNNIRKLYLTENGLNVEANNFVLGGIVYRKSEIVPDFNMLVNSLQLQKGVNDIKLAHIAKGNALQILDSKKLGKVFRWLLDNNVLIHYHNLDVLYWSIVDIVDSALAELKNKAYYIHHRYLKNSLYSIARADANTFLKLLYTYSYPNVCQERIESFITYLYQQVDMHKDRLDRNEAGMLLSLLNDARFLSDLPFISNEQSNSLIDHFFVFYITRFCLFKNSTHIVDNEDKIRERLILEPLTESGKILCNYEFVDSKSSTAIQISDIIVGFMGKYFTYISKADRNDLVNAKRHLSTTQIDNIHLFRSLIDCSDDVCNAFLHSVSCDEDHIKNNYFLFEQFF